MDLKQDSLGFLVADVHRLMRYAFQKNLVKSSLTLAQARALVYVARYEGLHQVELAQILEIKPITLARLLDQLSQDQLIERRPDPNDRRAYRIFLLPKAETQLLAIKTVGLSIQEQALKGLDTKQAELVQEVLRKIQKNLS